MHQVNIIKAPEFWLVFYFLLLDSRGPLLSSFHFLAKATIKATGSGGSRSGISRSRFDCSSLSWLWATCPGIAGDPAACWPVTFCSLLDRAGTCLRRGITSCHCPGDGLAHRICFHGLSTDAEQPSVSAECWALEGGMLRRNVQQR